MADGLPCVARCVGVGGLAVSASGSSTPVSASLACLAVSVSGSSTPVSAGLASLAVSVSGSSTSVSAVNNEFDRKSVTLKRLATLYKSSAGILKCTRTAQAIMLCPYLTLHILEVFKPHDTVPPSGPPSEWFRDGSQSQAYFTDFFKY